MESKDKEISKDLVPVADSDGTVFTVPRKHVDAIRKVVPDLRFDFTHLGGKHLGHVSQFPEVHAEETATEQKPDGGKQS